MQAIVNKRSLSSALSLRIKVVYLRPRWLRDISSTRAMKSVKDIHDFPRFLLYMYILKKITGQG